VGQGLFKERVSRIERACRITFVDNPTHLIASHIKPWRESTNEERLHEGNGLLLTPTVDHLFDRGFISFQDSGERSRHRVTRPYGCGSIKSAAPGLVQHRSKALSQLSQDGDILGRG
jgi:hypothetical protein